MDDMKLVFGGPDLKVHRRNNTVYDLKGLPARWSDWIVRRGEMSPDTAS